MKRVTIGYASPLDALVALAKRLGAYEHRHRLDSEDFFHRYSQGRFSDDVEFMEWASDYENFVAIRSEIKESLARLNGQPT